MLTKYLNGPLAKNPDKYVSYQQAQQQTEDIDLPTEDEDVGEDEVNDVVEVANDDANPTVTADEDDNDE